MRHGEKLTDLFTADGFLQEAQSAATSISLSLREELKLAVPRLVSFSRLPETTDKVLRPSRDQKPAITPASKLTKYN